MSARNPLVDLLLRGDVLAQSPLAYADLRARMLAALNARDPLYTQRASTDPGVALIEALAATMEVMAFYHDRFLTESKLESAILLESVAWLAQVVGFSPTPPIAAVGYQLFEAAKSGLVTAGTQVSGSAGDPPLDVVFETLRELTISPALNRMALSPILTRAPQALRAVIRFFRDPTFVHVPQKAPASSPRRRAVLPPDDFITGAWAVVRTQRAPFELELSPIETSRMRAVAFERPLFRSYAATSTILHRATRIRHLRFGFPLGDDDAELYLFELTQEPILHVPDASDPETLNSTLEVFVFDDPNESIGDPTNWDPKAAWEEVPDFSNSQASDRHYRTFVDDRLTTYILLRRKLGYRTLLSDDALTRVYARYIPAFGRMSQKRTLELDKRYFESSIIRPGVAGKAAETSTTWLVTEQDTGLQAGDQIAILGASSGTMYFRTLTEVEGPRLSWARSPKDKTPTKESDRPADEHAAVTDTFSADQTIVAPLEEIAAGQLYPLWADFYRQARTPLEIVLPTGAKSTPPIPFLGGPVGPSLAKCELIARQGMLFLLVGDSSHIKMGDYLLIGMRLTEAYRPTGTKAKDFKQAPWITAEVVQAIEVQGNLVRLKNPLSHDYGIYYKRTQETDPWAALTEVILVPAVASVYYGDSFTELLTLDPTRTFATMPAPSVQVPSFVTVALDSPLDANAIRTELGSPADAATGWSELFFAISGKTKSTQHPQWTAAVAVDGRGLLPAHIASLQQSTTTVSSLPIHAATSGGKICIDLDTGKAAGVRSTLSNLVMLMQSVPDLLWTPTQKDPPSTGQFYIAGASGSEFDPQSTPLDQALLGSGGLLVVSDGQAPPLLSPFTWSQDGPSLLFPDKVPSLGTGKQYTVTAASSSSSVDVSAGTFGANWQIPAPPAVEQAAWFTATSATGQLVLELNPNQVSRHTWKQIQGKLQITSIPVQAGTALNPLTGVQTVWLLANTGVTLPNANLWEIWEFTPSPTWSGATAFAGLVAIQQGSTKMLAEASGQPSGKLRIEVKSGNARTRFPTGNLQSVNALLSDPVTQTHSTTPVWVLTDGNTTAPDPNAKKNPTSSRPAVALERSTGTLVAPSNSSWWWNGDALCLENAPAVGADTSVTALFEYDDQGIPSNNCSFDTQHKSVTLTPPANWTWPDAPDLPLAFLVVTKGNNPPEIYRITNQVSIPQSGRQMTLTLDHLEPNAAVTWQAVYFVRRDLLTSKRSTITPSNGISVTKPTWNAPSSDTTVGLLFAKAGVPTSYTPTRMFYDSGTSEFLLVPRNGAFPSATTFDAFYLSIMSWDASGGSLTDAHAAVQIAPATLPAGINASDIAYLVLGNMPPVPWVPTQVSACVQDVLDLDQTLDTLLGSNLPASVSAGLVLASFNVTANDQSQVVGTGFTLTMRGSPSPAWLVRGAPSTTTALVFHKANTQAAISKQWVSLAAGSTAPWTLEIPDLGAETIFDPQGNLQCTTLAAAQDWSNVTDAAFTHEPLRIELGDANFNRGTTLDLQVGDGLLLNSSVQAKVTKVDMNGGKTIYELDHTTPTTLITIALSSVLTSAGQNDFSAKLDTDPVSGAAPWLFTFDPDASITDNLLLPEALTGSTQSTFEFVDPPSVDLIFTELKSGSPRTALLYENQIAKLSQDYYLSSSDSNNFFNTTTTTISAISAANGDPFAFPDGGNRPYVFLCSTAKPPDRGNVSKLGAQTGARTMGSSTVSAVSQSIVFNSGNFIPVLGNGSTNDYNVIVSALRVYSTDDAKHGPWELMTYDPNLSAFVQAMVLGKLQGTNGLSYTYPGPDGKPIEVTLPKRSYSFQKTADGTFTLNFLFVDLVKHEDITVKLIVQYGAPPVAENTTSSAIYKFETPVLPWSPSTELVVLDSGSLKPGDLLFLYDAITKDGEAPPIQWTRIQLVNGPILTVEPALHLANVLVENEGPPFAKAYVSELELPPPQQDAIDFLRYTLCGAEDPDTKFSLDTDYYTTMAKAALDPATIPSGMRLLLRDRLLLDPSRPGAQALLDSLIPGDTLLVWDERAKLAWRHHRLTGEPADPTHPPTWTEWPDAQFETQIKEIDPVSGLVVLTDALPETFFISFDQDPKTKRLAPDRAAVRALRVLPYYRAPFQGTRERVAIGSGDKSRRYARYTGTIAQSAGLAMLPLTQEEVFASNLELLVLDPRSNDWSRWVQFDTLESAGAKDLAYVLGVDTTSSPTEGVYPFSVSFGDGKKGQLLPTGDQNIFVRSTRIGGWAAKLPKARRLHVFAPSPPHVSPLTLPPAPCVVFIDSSAQEDYCPVAGEPSFRSSLGVETVDQNHHTIVWTEDPSAPPGKNTISVKGCRPGVIEVTFNTAAPPALHEIKAWELPDSRLWRPDKEFYAQMAADDPSEIAGAEHLQLLETDGLAPGSRLMLSQGDESLPEIATLASVDASTYSATLEAPLANRYPLGPSYIRGNLVDILQGSSDTIVLGSGDGSTRNLRLPVYSPTPLLFSFDESGDEEPGILVFVDGLPWPRELDFAGSGPRDRVFRLDIDPDGSVFVTFGDGHQGAVPPPGLDNITATIRTGEGGSGNLPIGAINELLDGNLAVKSTSNPIGSTGGYAGDDANTARQALLNRSGQIDRVVTAGDLTRVACQLGEAIFARLDPGAPFGEVWLVVTLGDRTTPTPNTLDVLTTRLQDLLPAATGVTLTLYGATQIPVYLIVRFAVVPGYRQADVLEALLTAFSASEGGFFAASLWPIGEALRLGDVYEAIFAVPGVASARVVWMDILQPPNAQSIIVAEAIEPGIRGVIRCDNDILGDPRGERGTITFVPYGASTS